MNRSLTAPPLDYLKGQRDMVQAITPTCPTCGGFFRSAKRVCRCCGHVIGHRHKWRMVPAGPGLWACEHWNCEDPAAPRKPAARTGAV